MKYSDVVANRRSCLWRDMETISPKPPKRQAENETAICWGNDVIECEDLRETITCLRVFTSPFRKAEAIR